MRSLAALLMIVLLSVGAGACGGAGQVADPESHTASSTTSTRSVPVRTTASALPQSPPSAKRYLNDGDGDIGGTEANRGYRDGDDGNILALGRVASMADTKDVTAVVTRYYALVAAGEGERACSMILPSLVKAIPSDYGQLGPSYLRGAKTCRAVVDRLSWHAHRELSVPVAVTGVLAKGGFAWALLGSATMPAGYIALRHERGAWMIAALLGGCMP